MLEELTTKDGAWRLDVDAFVPSPEGYVKIKGTEYPIYGFLDIPVEDSLKVARLGDDIDAAPTYEARMQRSIDQIMVLNAPAAEQGLPVLTRETFKGVRAKQLINLVVMATSVAKVPLQADGDKNGGPAGSPSPSPASADSTGGDARSSSV